jgi:hypothetical protein
MKARTTKYVQAVFACACLAQEARHSSSYSSLRGIKLQKTVGLHSFKLARNFSKVNSFNNCSFTQLAGGRGSGVVSIESQLFVECIGVTHSFGVRQLFREEGTHAPPGPARRGRGNACSSLFPSPPADRMERPDEADQDWGGCLRRFGRPDLSPPQVECLLKMVEPAELVIVPEVPYVIPPGDSLLSPREILNVPRQRDLVREGLA